MGKSKVDRLPSRSLSLKMPTQSNVHFYMPDLQSANSDKNYVGDPFSSKEMVAYPNQVSGHMNDGKHVGLMCCNGKIFKPADKPICFERETKFYEELNQSSDKSLKELKEHVPKYYGIQSLGIDGKKVDCIVLDDLTKNYKEPCIMDVKIGRRTWDPLASYEKILNEEQKYHLTKRELGFCITGFQVYSVSSGKLCKYGKDYGKSLDKDSVVRAFRTFLNADQGLNRSLLLQLLAALWRIQNWARKQRQVRLYSSSLLIIYDARKLKQNLEESDKVKPPSPTKPLSRSNSLYRPLSLAVLNGNVKEKIPTGFSGQLTHEGPILKSPTCPSRMMELCQIPLAIEKKEKKRSNTSVPTLKRMHSFQHNYDKDLQNMKRDYTYILDDLVSEERNELWANVKIIDFAHTFPANGNEVDSNYLEGIDNLVKIFEGFLDETEYS